MGNKYFLLLCGGLLLTGCMAGSHMKNVQSDKGDRLTVGKVQREIKIGMPSASVAEILGSPNIVSTDEDRREVWIYDKISSNASYSSLGLILPFTTKTNSSSFISLIASAKFLAIF